MPNGLIKNIAKQSGVKKSEIEHTWNVLSKEYNEDSEAIIGTLQKIYKYNAHAEDTNRQKTDFGHLKIKNCVLTAESVDPYLGSELIGKTRDALYDIDPNKTYNVYRPISELKKGLDTYNEVPLTNEHYFVDNQSSNKPKWLGGVGSKATIKDGKVINSVSIWDTEGVNLVERIKKEGLSCGYKYNLIQKRGVWNGKPYDFEMTDIVCNHIALVGSPRVKVSKLADSNNFIKDNSKMALEKLEGLLYKLLEKNPSLLIDSEKEEKMEKDVDVYYHGKQKDKKAKCKFISLDKKAKDKKAKDKKSKDNEHEKEEEKMSKDNEEEKKKEEAKSEDSRQIIADAVQQQLTHHLKTKELCESVIGKSTFGADSTPEQMIANTLTAKGVKHEAWGLGEKTAVLQYMAEHTAQDSKNKVIKHNIIADSSNVSDFKIINI